MKSSIECIPCFLNQALNAARRFGRTENEKERIMRRVLDAVRTFDRNRTSPEMGAMIHQIASEITQTTDLYAAEKQRCNEAALDIMPALRADIEGSADPFYTAVRIAVAGNLIDFTAPGGDTQTPLPVLFKEAVSRPLAAFCDLQTVARLEQKSKEARKILYLLDNAGEIVADRLLIEQLPRGKVTAVVRGLPIANDALMADAQTVGLPAVAEVVENGLGLPGTLLQACTPKFRQLFDEADMVISKGQGNFETLNFVTDKVFFLFVVKCAAVARLLNCAVGETVIADRPPLPNGTPSSSDWAPDLKNASLITPSNARK